MLNDQEQKLKDLKDLEEHTRKNLIKIQDDIRELENGLCDHNELIQYDSLQYICTNETCRKLFLLTPSPF